MSAAEKFPSDRMAFGVLLFPPDVAFSF